MHQVVISHTTYSRGTYDELQLPIVEELMMNSWLSELLPTQYYVGQAAAKQPLKGP